MTDETIELARCPFCDGEADYIEVGSETWVHCIDCGVGYGGKIPIERWNRRTDAAPGEAALGRELIAWAAEPINAHREDFDGEVYCIFCDILITGRFSHMSSCLHLRARALRDSE